MSIEFTLFYSGPLKANAHPKDKHDIRRAFHPQLMELWHQEPLCNFWGFINESEPESETIIKKRSCFKFVPLVNEEFHLVAEIEVTLLRPEPPGSILTQGGDIDNRLKTLFDSLKVPDEKEIPKGETPQEGEELFFCLLEDDKLITKVSLNTAQWLGVSKPSTEVVLLIYVKAKKLSTLMGGMELT